MRHPAGHWLGPWRRQVTPEVRKGQDGVVGNGPGVGRGRHVPTRVVVGHEGAVLLQQLVHHAALPFLRASRAAETSEILGLQERRSVLVHVPPMGRNSFWVRRRRGVSGVRSGSSTA